MSDRPNIESLKVVAEKLRDAERPYREAGNPRGLGIGAMALCVEDAIAEIERLRVAVKIADDDIRHHLRGDQISAAIIRPHAVKAIREAMK